MHKRIWFWVLFIGLTITCLVSAPQGFAQEESRVVVNFATPAPNQPSPDSLALQVFFTVTDGNGRPVQRPGLEGATLSIVNNPDAEPAPAVISDPISPINVVLVLDTSGSMQGVIGDVKEAAKDALRTAPPNAFFAVMTFDEVITVVQDFSNDFQRVAATIDGIQASNRGTCLYDATLQAMFELDDQIGERLDQRRAVILFTDGRDELVQGQGVPCSQNPLEAVLQRAAPSDPRLPSTPIHTIGLITPDNENVNRGELQDIASTTGAFSAIGGREQLQELFQDILDGLNSQLVATANIFPIEGVNQGLLTVTSRNVGPLDTNTFTFFSSRTFAIPEPFPTVIVNDVLFNPQNETYDLALGIGSASAISTLVINIRDLDQGVRASDDTVIENPGTTLVTSIDASGLEPGRSYEIRISAVDQNGELFINEDGETVLQTATVELPVADELEVVIQSVTPDFETGELIIDLNVSDVGAVQTYSGFVVDQETGSRVFEFGPEQFFERRIREQLPEVLSQANGQQEFSLTIELTPQEGTSAQAEFGFTPLPPPPPGLLTRIGNALLNNPIILIGILLVIGMLVFWLVSQQRRNKEDEYVPVRPPVEKTQLFGAAGPAANATQAFGEWEREEELLASPTGASGSQRMAKPPTLALQVTQTPNMAQVTRDVATTFPYTIGREGCNFNITGDNRISRQHVQITSNNGRFFVTDLGSRNGTFLNGTFLEANQPMPFDGNATLQLGSQTSIQLTLQS